MSVERCLYVSGSLFFGKNDLFSVEVFSPAIVHKMLIAAQLWIMWNTSSSEHLPSLLKSVPHEMRAHSTEGAHLGQCRLAAARAPSGVAQLSWGAEWVWLAELWAMATLPLDPVLGTWLLPADRLIQGCSHLWALAMGGRALPFWDFAPFLNSSFSWAYVKPILIRNRALSMGSFILTFPDSKQNVH